jgi:hypothetical protein
VFRNIYYYSTLRSIENLFQYNILLFSSLQYRLFTEEVSIGASNAYDGIYVAVVAISHTVHFEWLCSDRVEVSRLDALRLS